MHLLMVSLADAQGVPEALQAARPDWRVSVLQPTAVDLGSFGLSRPDPQRRLSYPLHLLPVLPRRPYPYALWWGLGRLLDALRPDLVYCFGEPSELGVAQVTWAARRRGLPVAVYSFENVDRAWRGWPRGLRGAAERWVLPRSAALLAASHGAADRLRRLGAPAARVAVVYPGAYRHELGRRDGSAVRQACGCGLDSLLLGFLGRPVWDKGLDLLLTALAALPATFRLVVAGDGPELSRWQALAAQLGVGGRVQWLGRTPRSAIATTLSACDALVLPSRTTPHWAEQFGMVLAEAMLCQTPVVGSSSGAIPEVIGDAGLVFREGDPAALTTVLRRLADPALRATLAARGLARAEARYTAEVHAARLAAVLDQAVAAYGTIRPLGGVTSEANMAQPTAVDEIAAGQRFAFGDNWRRFLESVTTTQMDQAVESLSRMLGVESLAGRRFLDLGCGSGLFSLAAARLGAEVVSIDFDPTAVACVQALQARTGLAWPAQQGSALDAAFLSTLGHFDVVYSWGVLHHTGDLWRAFALAAERVATGGLLFVSLYNDQGSASRRWSAVKRFYNRYPALQPLTALAVAAWFESRWAWGRLKHLQNPLPFAHWRAHQAQRGMSMWRDHVDWAGGLPYEVARPEAVLARGRELGFTLVRLNLSPDHGASEYVLLQGLPPTGWFTG
ncbi:MAG: glycosyltransferase [Fimbriimonadaceae bacterium]|nr:glycosyltransferase [Fimbriimonadaceae bacterium]